MERRAEEGRKRREERERKLDRREREKEREKDQREKKREKKVESDLEGCRRRGENLEEKGRLIRRMMELIV